jgi:transposase
MLLSSGPRRILAYRTPIDMRKSFDGLLGVVQARLREDPLGPTLFVFINRRGNFLKALTWDRTGFVLFAKRLEHGRFQLPSDDDTQLLSEQVLALILDGIVLGKRREVG